MHLSSLFPDGTNGVIFTFMSTFPLSMSGVSHTTVSYFLNAKSRLQSANDLFAILSCLILVRLISLINTPSSNGFTSPRSLPFSYIRLCPENTRSDVDSYIPADTYTYPHRQSDDTLPISLCLYAAFPMTSFDAERLSITSAPAMARSLPGETGPGILTYLYAKLDSLVSAAHLYHHIVAKQHFTANSPVPGFL